MERVDHQQRAGLLLVGNAVREVKAAEQQQRLPDVPEPDMPLREHDVVGQQQQARHHGVKPRRYVGKETIDEPERQQADGEGRYGKLQLHRPGAENIDHIGEEPRARAGVSVEEGVRGSVI